MQIVHVGQIVPGRQAEHDGDRELPFQLLDDAYHAVVAVDATHGQVRLTVAVERNVQVEWTVLPYGGDDALGGEAVAQQGVVGVVLPEPDEYLVSLGMEHELAALQAYGGGGAHALGGHDAADVGQREVLPWLLPDVAVAAAALAPRSSVEHEVGDVLVARPEGVVDQRQTVGQIIFQLIHGA